MTDTAILTIGDQRIELPIINGAEGDRSIDITGLLAKTGLTSYDPALVNTAICKSTITYIDGEKGILRYRGIPVEEFTTQTKPNFVEVAWLLIFGGLPSAAESNEFRQLFTFTCYSWMVSTSLAPRVEPPDSVGSMNLPVAN